MLLCHWKPPGIFLDSEMGGTLIGWMDCPGYQMHSSFALTWLHNYVGVFEDSSIWNGQEGIIRAAIITSNLGIFLSLFCHLLVIQIL